ncbi:MAG: hypothetical protein ACREAS_08550 [Nitrososphaera sp.]
MPPGKIANINGFHGISGSVSLPRIVSTVDRYCWKQGLQGFDRITSYIEAKKREKKMMAGQTE